MNQKKDHFSLFKTSFMGEMMIKLYIVVLIIMASTPAFCKTPFNESAKKAYIDRCTSSMVSQGAAPNIAKSFCVCIANGMSREFGLEEYNQMMKAEPNPKGTSYDKRLYSVFSSCSNIIK